MTVKKTGGPVTIAGKKIVSHNALKHGATSKRFLNSEEEENYTATVEDIKAYYKSPNPLVKFQIERIARINIQLQRIQDIIDASFAISRMEANGIQVWQEPTGNNGSNKKTAKKPSDEISYRRQREVSDQTRKKYIEIGKELIRNNYSALLTHMGYIQNCPKFCDFLFEQARRDQLNIEGLISRKYQPHDYPFPKSLEIFQHVNEKFKPEIFKPYPADTTTRDAIINTPFDSIKDSAKWIVHEYQLIQEYQKTLLESNEVQEIIALASTPDLEQLDKLMRYQTTLQRQISTAMGELIAITKI